jgi:hypothetical protein
MSNAALAALRNAGFSDIETDTFYVSPPGQHDLNPTGGDAPHSSEGSRDAGRGAVKGALIGLFPGLALGLLASLSLGTPSIWLTILLGALIGSIAGALLTLRAGRRSAASIQHPVEPRGGRLVAVNVDRDGTDKVAVDILKRHRARDVGRTHGQWRDGGWKDFDPRAPLGAV